MNIDNPKSKNIMVTSIMAMSINGRITRQDEMDVKSWTSLEDKEFFESILYKAESVIMGSNTFTATLKTKVPKYRRRLTVVLSHSPENFSEYSVEGVREFWNKSALETTEKLKNMGIKTALLLGGSRLNSEFFEAGLVDELWLTIEPKIFGKGKLLIEDFESFELNFRLESHIQLNDSGTLLLHYVKI
ncbi:MAG: dihydrofolate reductase family protein [bacterium]|nr:dihydrofolate reductase family protein [bacterium]